MRYGEAGSACVQENNWTSNQKDKQRNKLNAAGYLATRLPDETDDNKTTVTMHEQLRSNRRAE